MYGSDSHIIDTRNLRDPAEHGALDKAGRLLVLPAAFWDAFKQEEICTFCVKNGFYHVPTIEFCEWLRTLIGPDLQALEIGAGNGVQAAYLGMRATDNYLQTWPDIKQLYGDLEQATVPYGRNVEKVDGLVAAKHYGADVIVAAWVTHKYDKRFPQKGGNMYGVDEGKLLKLVKSYVHIGHTRVHQTKLIRAQVHRAYTPPGLVCRALAPGHAQVLVWGRQLPGES
jgi:hypothetical protein